MTNRDDFTKRIKETLAKRVGFHCSNPSCKIITSGPHENKLKSTNIGIAAHITAAAAGGPRFNEKLTLEERKDISNGIWLCIPCSNIIDKDPDRFPVELLKKWKEVYTTSDMEKFFRVKNLLDAQNIAYKTNTTNNNLRLSMNNLTGSSVALSRDGSVKDFYEVLVEEKDEARARAILSMEN